MSTTDPRPRVMDVRTAAETWRPQQFSEGRATSVDNPIVEPVWSGLRVLALVDDGTVTFRDLDGDIVEEFDAVASELVEASRAAPLLFDGYLTHQPIQGVDAVAYRERDARQKAIPTIGQLWFGLTNRDRKRDKLPPIQGLGREAPAAPDEDVAIVLVDLLWLDNEPLLSVPLLERKRILESVVGESRLVRRGTYIRPPIDTWVGSWRSFGFSRLAYKAANSRYTPGSINPQWAIGDLPRR